MFRSKIAETGRFEKFFLHKLILISCRAREYVEGVWGFGFRLNLLKVKKTVTCKKPSKNIVILQYKKSEGKRSQVVCLSFNAMKFSIGFLSYMVCKISWYFKVLLSRDFVSKVVQELLLHSSIYLPKFQEWLLTFTRWNDSIL